ncbi:primosomal replication protein N [Gallaecimonas sp. GXIMD4217]|uniref:primosomal replication protein N n=1 Tax=Gallaecimonas sp. GXIMD4217 TaxID=3131927 RepID=UPI00311B3E2F
MQLTGQLVRAPRRSQSPAGVKHCQFWLEHRSEQVEAEMTRPAYCRIQVVASGDNLNQSTWGLTMGQVVTVTGFLVSHRSKEGNLVPVLHAQRIDLLN